MRHETPCPAPCGLLRGGKCKHSCLVTETWGIAALLLACPVILGFLLAVLSALEDSLAEAAAPAMSDPLDEPIAVPSGREATPDSTVHSGRLEPAPVAEGAHL